MFEMSMITKPLVGAVIGYSTNWLAIKMLFKPHAPKYIGKFRIPFTPGLIPKERERIARSLGTAVGEKLLTDEVIKKELLNDKVIAHIKNFIINDLLSEEISPSSIIEKIFGEEDTVIIEKMVAVITEHIKEQIVDEPTITELEGHIRNYLMAYIPYEGTFENVMPTILIETISDVLESNKDKISGLIVAKAKDEEVVAKIKEVVSAMIIEKVGALGAMFVNPDDIASSIVAYIEKTVYETEVQSQMTAFILESVDKGIKNNVSDLLSQTTYEQLVNYGSQNLSKQVAQLIENYDMSHLVGGILRNMLDTPIVLTSNEKKKIEAQVEALYCQFVNNHVATFLATFELKGIVEGEVNRFSVDDIESLIFTIVDKELKAITWFGALLGFVMGITMIFI